MKAAILHCIFAGLAMAGAEALAANKENAVLRTQVLLDRAHFSSGEIDGRMGSNLRRALTGFQRANALKESAVADAATLARLDAEGDATPTLVSYTIADADVAGPFQPTPKSMQEQGTLSALSYASPVEALAEKFHASPALLRALNPGKDFARAGEQIMVPNVVLDAPLPKADKVVVSRSERALTLYDAAGAIIGQSPATTGSSRDPLPIGNWKIKGVARNPVFHFNPKLFWDAEPGAEKAKIAAGPNNPVGVVWIDLNKEHYGIHGTPQPGTIGKTQSHGCIRLTNWDATRVADAVAPGTAVVLQE